VVEGRGGSCFQLEPAQTVRILGHLLRQNLDRDLSPQPRVAGLVDFPHSAGAERSDDLVGTEAFARRQTTAAWFALLRGHSARRFIRPHAPGSSGSCSPR
jgi:hypothetical protein